jgi:hypothetical protein
MSSAKSTPARAAGPLTLTCPTPSELQELLPYLLPQELVELQHHLKHLPFWTPQPGPQSLAYESQADIVGYGGAAGGGKTDLLLGLALTRHTRSVIFRREATTLRDMVFRSQAVIGEQGSFNGSINVWRDLPGGRILEFGGVKEESDVNNWRGRAHDGKFFDEATEFSEAQFRALIAWNRTTIPGQRCRVVACFNPPTTALGRWVLSYWAPWLDETHPHPAKIGELRWFARLDDKAKVSDNLFLRGTTYEARLQSLPEPLRSQLWLGDFRAGLRDDARQLIATDHIRAAQRRWKPTGRGDRKLSALGVDVARGGAAKTVRCPRFGTWFGELRAVPGAETKDGQAVRRLIVQDLTEFKSPGALVCVDSIGIGSSAVDLVREVPDIQLFPVNFGARTRATDKSGLLGFANLRAFAFWSLRELLDPSNGFEPALPPDPELLGELQAIRWDVRSGLILIEPKEKIAERIGRSPDKSDALAYSILTPPQED